MMSVSHWLASAWQHHPMPEIAAMPERGVSAVHKKCVSCGKKVAPDQIAFDMADGRVMCLPCMQQDPSGGRGKKKGR